MPVKFLKRRFWQRILGISATKKPENPDAWHYASGELVVHLDKVPELTKPGGAFRFEGDKLPHRILVVCGEDKQYRAFKNKCTHFGHRRLDYVPGTETIQCCSVNKSTYSFNGEKIHGPTKKPVDTFPVKFDGDELRISIS